MFRNPASTTYSILLPRKNGLMSDKPHPGYVMQKEVNAVKTKEELNALKEEVKTMKEKLSALTEEELEQVTGGGAPAFNDYFMSVIKPAVDALLGLIE